MHLKSLEISGFKSFAKRAILEFTSPISAIVGPNGSGKSNVAEAFRFVLGEQSLKSMRGKRGEDLIFNGTSKVARQQRAAVKITFDNSRRVLPIDFDEVVIERIVHRDSVNEYFVNGTHVRLKDIIELLSSAHIGATGHHIISQGEADKILTASDKERKEMIEDALGLKIFQWKRLEAERKLEKTDENIQHVESLRRELAPHIKFLGKQVEKIQKAKELKSSLVLLYKDYLSRESYFLEESIKDLHERSISPQAEREQISLKLEELRVRIGEKSGGARSSSEVVGLEKKMSEERERQSLLMRDLGRIEGELGYFEREIHRLLKETSDRRPVPFERVSSLEAELDSVMSEALAEESKTKKDLVSQLRAIIKAFFQSIQDAKDEVSLGKARAEIARLQEQRAKLDAKYQDSKNAEHLNRVEYEHLRQSIEDEQVGSLEAEKEMLKVMKRLQEVENELSAIGVERSQLERQRDDFAREVREAILFAGSDAARFEPVASYREWSSSQERSRQAEKKRMTEKTMIRLEEAGAAGGDELLKEYEESFQRSEFLRKEVEDLVRASASLQTLIAELDIRIKTEFESGLGKINNEFSRFFTHMFGGGSASLSLVKKTRKIRESVDVGEISENMSEEPVAEEGIEVKVGLPHKRIQGLVMLSGGERALASIALLFAMSQVNPPPFIILDETDAALDEANSRKYGDMIEHLAKYSQLILITHNRETMSRAGILYGITMGSDGTSRLLSIAFDEAVKVAK